MGENGKNGQIKRKNGPKYAKNCQNFPTWAKKTIKKTFKNLKTGNNGQKWA